MRENMKKREGLAMGKYRDGRSLPSGVKWVKEGEFIISLGSPVGNNMDHDQWWKKKIQAVQGKAQRWLGLFQAFLLWPQPDCAVQILRLVALLALLHPYGQTYQGRSQE